MAIFFTSDQHYFHANIIKYSARPFASVEEMNETMIANHNAIVGPDDTVFMLGDYSLSKSALTEILPRLNGKEKHLIAGNHDHCHPTHAKPAKLEEMRQLYLDSGFATVQLQWYAEIDGYNCLMHHMPYRNPGVDGGPSYDEKFANFRPKDEGLILLHGHVHERWKRKGRMINLGVDCWDYKPVSMAQVIEQIREAKAE